ncbi:MAG: LacI family transcriptional regulator, partial [Lachnospiraceae bacterium]|nr:LacI family transcriptional regulator [Lachnospiraceae bacterium]
MKKVALFSDGWKRLITYAWVDGMMKFIAESDEDICLYQYNCHGNWSHDEMHNQGEYNIYTLPDLSSFDGIIMDCTNISDKNIFDRLVDMIRKSGKPVVSIGNHIEGFYYAGIDNKKPIADMMEHLYHKHNCRTFVFAGGPKDNYENELRVLSYQESLDRLGLSRDDNPVWYGDYDFSTGIQYFEQYLAGFEGKAVTFPDVFVCANDNIAAGFCYKAQQYGYEIPKDFRITGFDNLDKAVYFDPQITTVSHMRENIGNKTIEILVDVWAGKAVPMNHFMPSNCVFSESCGCPNSGLLDYRQYARNQVISEVDRLEREELLTKFESDIIKCEDYDAFSLQIADYFMSLECDGYAIILDKRLYDGATESVFATDGYDWEHLTVAYAANDGQLLDIKNPQALLAFYEANGSGCAYMYSP